VRSDADIIRRSVESPQDFGEIFRRHYASVAAYASRRLGTRDGEDIAANAFIIAFERRSRFDTRYPSAKPWLLGITANLVRHHLRDERVHAAALTRSPVDAPAAIDDDPDRLDAWRLRPVLAAALLSLSEDDRETFLLVALGEITYEEAAAALGIPVGTVRSRLHRARRAMRERLHDVAAISSTEGQRNDADG
jgi:RNA polymerase sigma factor (sigma-70 family)